jgi:hypothetical protein
MNALSKWLDVQISVVSGNKYIAFQFGHTARSGILGSAEVYVHRIRFSPLLGSTGSYFRSSLFMAWY